MGVAQWWAQRLGRDLRAHPVSNNQGLYIIGPMRVLVSSSANILVSLSLYFKLQHFIIYLFFYNLRTYVITVYSGHVCDVLYINTSLLTTYMDAD
jgi:hypothetical protein